MAFKPPLVDDTAYEADTLPTKPPWQVDPHVFTHTCQPQNPSTATVCSVTSGPAILVEISRSTRGSETLC